MSGKQCRPDQMSHSMASDLGLHCLLKTVCLNTHGEYCKNSVALELFSTPVMIIITGPWQMEGMGVQLKKWRLIIR